MYIIPDIHTALEPAICWSGAFSSEDINEIIKYGDILEFNEAKVGNNDNGGVTDNTIRNSKVSWIIPNEQNAWLFNKMSEIIAIINKDKYQFNLSHIESFQYTTYTTGGFYSWHIDGAIKNSFGPSHRKLGFTLMLSDPETDFTGGNFEIIPGGNPTQTNTIPAKQGDIIAFPSFVPHQVSEVLSGKRKSLVCWVLGPKFK